MHSTLADGLCANPNNGRPSYAAGQREAKQRRRLNYKVELGGMYLCSLLYAEVASSVVVKSVVLLYSCRWGAWTLWSGGGKERMERGKTKYGSNLIITDLDALFFVWHSPILCLY